MAKKDTEPAKTDSLPVKNVSFEKISNEKVKIEKGYIYYVGNDHYVWRKPKDANIQGKSEKVGTEKIEVKSDYSYFVNREGYVCRVPLIIDYRARGLQQIIGGLIAIVIGLIITIGSYKLALGGYYLISFGPILFGIYGMLKGFWNVGKSSLKKENQTKRDIGSLGLHKYIIIFLILFIILLLMIFVGAFPTSVLLRAGTSESIPSGLMYYVNFTVSQNTTLTGSYTSTLPIDSVILTQLGYQELAINMTPTPVWSSGYGTLGSVDTYLTPSSYIMIFFNNNTRTTTLNITSNFALGT